MKVDPAGLSIDDVLHLLFCARERDVSRDLDLPSPPVNGHNGHGIWHATAIPSGATLLDYDKGTREKSVYCKHFLVRAGRLDSGTRVWPDLVVASDVTAAVPRVFQDPDGWVTAGGRVNVFAGAAGATWLDAPFDSFRNFKKRIDGPLVRIEGSLSDVDWDWADAFDAGLDVSRSTPVWP